MDKVDFSWAYVQHGIIFNKTNGKQRTADCPFCGKTNHFVVNRETGQCQCLRNDKCCSGNIYTFIRKLHSLMLADTTKDDYRALKEKRPGLSWLKLREDGFALDRLNDQWICPVYSVVDEKTKLTNLQYWDEEKGELRNTATCKSTFSGVESIKPEGPIFICEGRFDKVALIWLLEEAKYPEPYSIISVPGAGIFPESQLAVFKGRDLIFLYDHDEAGRNGTQKAVTKLTNSPFKPKSVKTVRWYDTLGEGYDVRDFVRDNLKQPKMGWKALREILIDYDESGLKRIKRERRESFAEVIEDFKKQKIHMERGFKDALAICLATAFSVRIPGDPIWLLLVAVPGSGKTMLLESFLGSDEYCYAVSKMTSQTLISGWKDADGKEASLLPTLNGRTLVIKDYTTIKMLPQGTQEELYGLLRDIYDGHTHVIFGNRQDKEFRDIHFSIIAGVTDIIHGDNRATLGERFLKVELLDDDHDHEAHIRAAMRGSSGKDNRVEHLRKSILGFLDRSFSKDDLPEIPLWVEDRIVALSQIIGLLRANVDRDKQGLKYRPRAELGTRVAVQLKRLAECLAFVYGLSQVNERCMRLVEKVALDSVVEFNLEIVQKLANCKHPLTAKTLHEELRLSLPTIRKSLDNLRELHVVDFYRDANNTGHGGKKTGLWELDERVQDLWRTAFKTNEAKIIRRRRRIAV